MTTCTISKCDRDATRQLRIEGLGEWEPYCDDCSPLADTSSERPIPPGEHYADVTDLLPRAEDETLCAFCHSPVFTFERCSWCGGEGDDPGRVVNV